MTDTITLPRAEAQKVLDALEDSKTYDDGASKWDRLSKSISVVRAALAQQAEQDEVGINGLTDAETRATMSVRGLSKPKKKNLLLTSANALTIGRTHDLR